MTPARVPSTAPPGLAARIADLLRSDAFSPATDGARVVETHISWVVLAGDYVYKLRKPVNYGFLDFSTREQRRADCEAEVRLNRRLCPDVYLGVVEVVERDGRLAWTGPGTPVEPAVLMRRLPDAGMLPAPLEADAASGRLLERVATHLANFHAVTATGAGVDEHGRIRTVCDNWLENFAQLEQTGLLGRALTGEVRDRIRTYVEEFMARNVGLFQRRVEQGRIRDGHGDLHASSICVVRRRLYLFDCLEFSARFRCADVAAEVAFLAMDLDHLGRADLSQTFVDAYVRLSNDVELPALLNFYKCYRACVRGKVLGFRLQEPDLDRLEAERIAREVRAYFDLANGYTRQEARPVLVVTLGLPASGKSTLARALAGRLGLVRLSSDDVRKHLAGVRPAVHQLDGFERGMYTHAMGRRTYAALNRMAARWLRRGQSVVLDATFGKPSERAAVRQLGTRAGAHVVFIVCTANESMLRARLAARELDPRVVSDARLELWPELKAAFVEPTDVPEALLVDTTGPLESSVDELVDSIPSATPASVVSPPLAAAAVLQLANRPIEAGPVEQRNTRR